MKIGDKVRCVSGGYPFTEGKEYTIIDFDQFGHPNFQDDDGYYDNSFMGYSLDGDLWKFELVNEGEAQ